MKQARDLFLLSSIAYQQGKYSESGTLFATAMASSDVDEFLNLLNEEQTVTTQTLLSISSSVDTSLEIAASRFTQALSADEDEEDTVPQPSDETDAEEDFQDDKDEFVDDVDTDIPGQHVAPGSLTLAPTNIIGQSKSSTDLVLPKIVISSTLKSPVRIRTA